MKKVMQTYTAIIQTVILVSLYVSAAFITFELLYLGFIGGLSIEVMLKSLILSSIYISISILIKKKYPTRFLHSKVSTVLSIFLATALSMHTLQLLDSSFESQYSIGTNFLGSNQDFSMLREITFYVMGVFFLIAIPIILLMSWFDQKRRIKVVNYLLALVLFGTIIFMIDSFERGGMAKTFFLQGLKPLTIFIIGSLSFGWIRELFIRSMEK
ncbi:hypothetical protein KA078_02645 [Candidatus Woesebacteria bacterium]|nr:hypothetical protein [Candidatus Woesebacteria bacterium]